MIQTKWLLPFGIACIALGISFAKLMRPELQPALAPEPIQIADTLSDWQMLTLAIAMTESRFNPNATGKTGDRGILQLTEIYVREVNRILGADYYAPEDAYDPLKSIHMFSVVQDYRNPEHDQNKAIKLHNPGGAAIGYPQKVKRNLEFVKRMEAVRAALKEYEYRKSI